MSESFLVPLKKGNMELEVKMININYREDCGLLERSQTLHDYSLFIQRVREALMENQTRSRDEAIGTAIRICIRDGILKDYLTQRGSEVHNMLMKEFDMEEALKIHGEEEREEGIKEGIKKGIEKGRREVALKLLDILEIEIISEKTGLTIEEITELRNENKIDSNGIKQGR